MPADHQPGNPLTSTAIRPWTFKPRWRIEGSLVTLTPLHIGSGASTSHPDLLVAEEGVEINGHIVDHAGRACIFGSTLKGCVRSWLEDVCKDTPDHEARRDHLLGQGPKEKKALQPAEGESAQPAESVDDQAVPRGGAAEFHDALLTMCRTEPTPLPYWRPDRQTWIETSTSIDRATRTAAPNHLIHNECVPAGVGFDVVITGCFQEEDMRWLLATLDGFNYSRRPILLGADTRSGKGRLRWELGGVFTMARKDVRSWLNRADRGLAEGQMRQIANTELAKELPPPLEPTDTDILTIPITLKFDSHFLVNDPPTAREMKEKEGANKPPNHRPRLTEMGCALLPAKSFRGALRSQAERILRTLGLPACSPTDPKGTNSCAQLLAAGKEIKELCLACQTFGAPGWRSPLAISDFHLNEEGCDQVMQEFVAIDRFTGGAKDQAKFNALALYCPVLEGCLRVHTPALSQKGWALLALTLRDLKEGDITFGFGAAKGYGTCTWQTTGTCWEEEEFQTCIKAALAAFRDGIPND